MLYHSLYGEPLLYSLYLALLSIAIFGSRVFRSLLQGRVHPTRNVTSNAHEDQDDSGLYSEESERRRALLIFSIKKSVREMGSVTFVLKSLRALSCIALVVITVAASITLEDSSKDWSAHDVDNGQWRHTNSVRSSVGTFNRSRWVELIKVLFYVSPGFTTCPILFAFQI